MAENPTNSNAAAPNKRNTTNNNFYRMRNRYQGNRNTGPKQRPVSLLIPQPASSSSTGLSNRLSDSSSNIASGAGQPTETASFRINRQSGPYSGWKLYFPEIGNTVATKLNKQKMPQSHR